ncbi:probable inactive DNA (cytosine-5)-methyltransferase DRM3 isoform X2 [Ipomoea triloba]|uniref:probable inactive DNA (cytosine-5)-methyltransferase DRM3 isoform X2 n=1 Tax=Ipomoea triloba TaxID=35885 RepID=UPI00125D8AA3|nr:probable inactive DNA (cytosine-5)-methyltransferase DRM3 isoform X2 [Ipomoea triloba]XP_031112141.1 probable inactive DNA (cytosine-5)-methyltransferase DRM3 isoform X2 [Ipomoea triloba]
MVTDYSNNENVAKPETESAIMPKTEALDYDLPAENMYPQPMGNDVGSSSGSNVRSSLLAMGFSPSLVDRAIEENGDDNVDLLLETLFTYPDLNRSDSSDSLDSLFGDEKDPVSLAHRDSELPIKEELDICVVRDEKKESLLAMDFSLDEVEFAMSKLGREALVTELVDFILAARIAGNLEREPNLVDAKENEQEFITETLFGTMEKTLRLIEMGFSENEISTAIEKYGSEIPLEELAESIVSDKIPNSSIKREKYFLTSLGTNSSSARSRCRPLSIASHDGLGGHCFDPLAVKREEPTSETYYESSDLDLLQKFRGKRPKEEYIDQSSNLKRPKQEYDEGFSSSLGPEWEETNFRNFPPFSRACSSVSKRRVPHKARLLENVAAPRMSMPSSCRSLDRMVAKPPYFFYGTIMNLSHDTWVKISQFLYAIEPEFVNTQSFSALSRREGYVHNLPTGPRFHILPKPPMTIQEVMPHTSKWWPSWDTRKQLSYINAETSGISQVRDRIERILADSRGLVSAERQKDIIRQCETLNLVWVGRNRLGPIEAENVESILGYPINHTRTAGLSLMDRLQVLKHCVQIDTLAYHLSILKSLYPGGLKMLSIYNGIGGAEIALHRLGIELKVVVCVEASESKRRILKQWWESSGQKGELVQIEDVQKLASNRLEVLVQKYGGFDFIICQNPCTYALKSSVAADFDGPAGLDFTMFYEFVRVLQRVRSKMERNQ